MAEALLRLQFAGDTFDLVVPEAHADVQLPALTEFVYDTWQRSLPWTQATYQTWVAAFEDPVLPRLDQLANGWIDELDHYYSARFTPDGALDVLWEDQTQAPSRWRRAVTRSGLASLAQTQVEAAADRRRVLAPTHEARVYVDDWETRRTEFLSHVKELFGVDWVGRTVSFDAFDRASGRSPEWTDRLAAGSRNDWTPVSLDHPRPSRSRTSAAAPVFEAASPVIVLAEAAPGSSTVVASDVLAVSGFDTRTSQQITALDQDAGAEPVVLVREGAAFDIALQPSTASEDHYGDAYVLHGWIEHNRLEGSRYVLVEDAASPDQAAQRMAGRIAVLQAQGWSILPDHPALGPLTVTGPQRLSAFAAAYTGQVMASALSVFPRSDLERALANMVPTSSWELRHEAGHTLVGHWVLANAVAECGVPEATEVRKRVERALLAVDPQVALAYYRRMAVIEPATAMAAAVWAGLKPYGYSREAMAEAALGRMAALADLAATDGDGLRDLHRHRTEARGQASRPLGAPEMELPTPYPAVYRVDWLLDDAAAGRRSYGAADPAPPRIPDSESATTCWFDIATGTGAESWAGYAARHTNGYWRAWLVVPEGHPLHGVSDPPRALAEATFAGTAAQAGLTGQSGDQTWLIGFECRTGHVTGALPPGTRQPEDLDLNAVRARLTGLASRIDTPGYGTPGPVGVAAWPARTWERPPGPDAADVTPAVAALARAPRPTAASRTGRSR